MNSFVMLAIGYGVSLFGEGESGSVKLSFPTCLDHQIFPR